MPVSEWVQSAQLLPPSPDLQGWGEKLFSDGIHFTAEGNQIEVLREGHGCRERGVSTSQGGEASCALPPQQLAMNHKYIAVSSSYGTAVHQSHGLAGSEPRGSAGHLSSSSRGKAQPLASVLRPALQ